MTAPIPVLPAGLAAVVRQAEDRRQRIRTQSSTAAADAKRLSAQGKTLLCVALGAGVVSGALSFSHCEWALKIAAALAVIGTLLAGIEAVAGPMREAATARWQAAQLAYADDYLGELTAYCSQSGAVEEVAQLRLSFAHEFIRLAQLR